MRSASTWRFDTGAKRDRYQEAGVAELWLVDTASDTVLVHRRSSPKTPTFDVALELGTDAELTSPLLPGFSLSVRELFDR